MFSCVFAWFCFSLFLFSFFDCGRRRGPWHGYLSGGWDGVESLARRRQERNEKNDGRWTYSAHTERGKPKVRSSLERRNINFRGLSRFRPPLFWDRFFDHFSGSRPGWAAFSLDFCDLVAFCLGETDGGCKMAKIGAFSINCMDRGWGRGRSLKVFSSRCGSDKSMPLTTMLSKALKVANESVHATPLRWPLAFHHLSLSFPCVCETDCLKCKGSMHHAHDCQKTFNMAFLAARLVCK